MEKISNQQEQVLLNRELSIILKKLGIKKLIITFFGNSISSGYSMTRTIKPLTLRNTSINEMMRANGVEVELHNFARAQNNGDEHLFEWIVQNIKESEINKMVRNDYSGGPTTMPCDQFDKSYMDEYYPIDLEEDKGLRDIIENNVENTANIIIYNGCTGSFLDAVTRHGNLSQMLTYGINRDVRSLEAILKYIHASNRKNNSNTQIYACGAPNLLGLHITGIINRKIKKAVKQYSNATYVDPIFAKVFYKNILTNKTGIDIHYSEDEYDKDINQILKSIIVNYPVKRGLINTDREMYKLSSDFELSGTEIFKEKDFVIKSIEKIISEQKFTSAKEELQFYKQALKHLTTRSPYDFCYVGKDNIKEVLKQKIKG